MNIGELKQMQSLPLLVKIEKSKLRIQEFFEHYDGQVYVSFSGGKDSTVLLHLVRSLYPEVVGVFSDTGLEYPEIKQFIKTFDNIITVRPEMSFKQVVTEYGYPVISKKTARMISDIQNPTDKNSTSRKLYLTGEKSDGTQTKHFKLAKKWHKLIDAPFKTSGKCCDILKKNPIKKFEKETKLKSFVGTMASDSSQRESSYLQTGCNSFSLGKSQPLGFWNEQDIWDYLEMFNVPYCKIYDMGEKRTGCIFCMFGVHLEKGENRFERMATSHPKLHEYCMTDLGLKEVLEYIDVPTGNKKKSS